ncbi:MAG: hypothetical protein E7316_02450 [Clostridiales bacterium]|nr:hypothetical protein [Clostridiales bacterium]
MVDLTEFLICVGVFLGIILVSELKNKKETVSDSVDEEAKAYYRGGYIEGYREGQILARAARSKED